MKKLSISLVASAFIAAAASASSPTITPGSEANNVNIIRGVQIVSVDAETTLTGSDLVVSSAGDSYVIALDNCKGTIEGEYTLNASQVVCQDGNILLNEEGNVRPIVIGAGIVGGIVLISQLTDDDDDGAPASP